MNKIEIEKLVEHIEEKADAIFGINLERLNVLHTIKGTTAGYCRYGVHYNFNPQIARDNDGFEQTVWHEVAHQIAIQVYGKSKGHGHGIAWKTIMRKLGREPNRCHHYTTIKPGRITKKYRYECGCGAVLTLSSVRYNKQMRGKASYSHSCGRKLELSKAVLVEG